MKIESIGITALEDGSRVIIAVKLDAREELEQDDVARIFNLVREIGGASDMNADRATRDTAVQQAIAERAPEIAKALDDMAKLPEDPAPEPTTRRRRHVNPLETAGEAAQSAPAVPTEPARRRRAPVADAGPGLAATNPSESEAAQEAPANPTRRRRAVTADTTTAATPDAGSATTVTEPTTRRRRASASPDAGPAAAQSAPSDGSEISDTDLSKAASAAAVTILPKGVMTILGHYDCKAVGELPANCRRKFLEDLKHAVKEAA